MDRGEASGTSIYDAFILKFDVNVLQHARDFSYAELSRGINLMACSPCLVVNRKEAVLVF